MMIKNGFTLQEVLTTILIIGVVAVLTVPYFLSSTRAEITGLQLKNFTTYLQQIMSRQMLKEKTRSLKNTQFNNPDVLLKPETGVFDSIKYCPANKAAKECWKVAQNSTNPKVSYNTMSGSSLPDDLSFDIPTIILKNGNMFGMYKGNIFEGHFDIHILLDVNGPKKPNMVGIDLFKIIVSGDSNKIFNVPSMGNSYLLDNCKEGYPDSCFLYVMNNDWNVLYDK